ncbi:MAG: hypothetical protein H0U04_17255 [Rubrobacter sp.]|nr:hypothetical protein [Rubrobacter sp.]
MARRKMTTYVDEELLRSAKVLAARRDGKVYEVFEEALRRYLEEPELEEPELGKTETAKTETAKTSLAEALLGLRTRRVPGVPGVPREKAKTLSEGDTLSDAVLAERESRDY